MAQIAIFGMGCPRAGDADLDGKYREGCPVRAEEWNRLRGISDAIWDRRKWSGVFKNSFKEQIDCKADLQRPFSATVADSGVVLTFMEFFDSIRVEFTNGEARLFFEGYVDPRNRDYPKGHGVPDDGMGDTPETIVAIQGARIGRISLRSPNGVVLGDFKVKVGVLIPMSGRSVWPCKFYAPPF